MTDTIMLDDKIRANGFTMQFVAEQLGLSSYGFAKKRKNETEFTSSEITKLCKLLKIRSLREKEAIFFKRKVEN